MKKLALAIFLLSLVAMPALAEWRADIGVIVPRGAGLTLGGSTATTNGDTLMNWPFIPLPEAGIYYQGNLGAVRVGLGFRAFTLILETFTWPNAFVEVDLGKLTLQAQLGGAMFIGFGLASFGPEYGNVFFPDLSAWYRLGKNGNFRLGIGAIGLYLPEVLGDGLPFMYYLGGKATIGL